MYIDKKQEMQILKTYKLFLGVRKMNSIAHIEAKSIYNEASTIAQDYNSHILENWTKWNTIVHIEDSTIVQKCISTFGKRYKME